MNLVEVLLRLLVWAALGPATPIAAGATASQIVAACPTNLRVRATATRLATIPRGALIRVNLLCHLDDRNYARTSLSGWLALDARTSVGNLIGLDLRARGVSGRLYRITVYGSAGSKTVSADIFRAVIDAHLPAADPPIRSDLFGLAPIR